MRSWNRALWLLSGLLVAQSTSAQDLASSNPVQDAASPNANPSWQQVLPRSPVDRLTLHTTGGDQSGAWVPLGPIPVDQAGAGRRGYVLPAEGSDVTLAGASQFSIHTVAANNFYREQTSDFLVSQHYETHTLAIGYRRGFALGRFPRFEIGGQLQLHQADGGMLNDFIEGFESLWGSMTGNPSSKNLLRTGETPPPQGTVIARDGSPIYRDTGSGSGLGDVSLIAKAVLVDGGPASRAARVSARIGVNVAGSSQFSAGSFVGAGLSLDKKLLEWLAFHGDVRATRILDGVSPFNLPLRRMTYGFSVGPELRLPRNSSFGLQIDGSTSPYLPTGTLAFDEGYGDVTFSVGHRFATASREVTMHFYARENMNMPFQVRWNTDPDLSVGLKVTVR